MAIIIIVIKILYRFERNLTRAMRRVQRWLGFIIIINTRFGGSGILLLSTPGEDNSRVRRRRVTVRKLIHSRTRRPGKGFKGRIALYRIPKIWPNANDYHRQIHVVIIISIVSPTYSRRRRYRVSARSHATPSHIIII